MPLTDKELYGPRQGCYQLIECKAEIPVLGNFIIILHWGGINSCEVFFDRVVDG